MSIFDKLTGEGGCIGTCEGSVAVSGMPILNGALAVLSGVMGTWGLIEQYKINRRMTELAEQGVTRAEGFLTLAKTKYNTVDIPTFTRTRALYDRYKTFHAREDAFLCEAFELKAWCVDYCLAEGRAITQVNRVFDRSWLAKRRSLSRYETGRACHDLTYFGLQKAMAKASAAQAAYNAENAKKLEYDKWYWGRFKAGATYLISMGNRAINALTQGSAGLSHGLSSIADALKVADDGRQSQAGALANQASFWGGVSEQGFKGFGTGVGNGYFNSTPAQTQQTYSYGGSMKDSAPVQHTPQYQPTYTPLK